MQTTIAMVAAVALVAALAPGAMAEVETDVRTLDPARLGRGPDARIDFLQDGVIHGADGTSLRVLPANSKARRQLLGRVGKSWAVAVMPKYTGRVDLFRKGRKPTTVRKSGYDTYGGSSHVGWRLSRDGDHLLQTVYDRGGSTTSVSDRRGKRMGSMYSGYFYAPLDADAGHVVTFKEGLEDLSVVDWVPRESKTVISEEAAVWASIEDDVLFTGGKDGYGPAPLSAPTSPSWTALFEPLDISPDGSTVIGLRLGSGFMKERAVLEVREMTDGALLAAYAFGPGIGPKKWDITSRREQTARFEDDESFVFQLTQKRGSVLVRCSVAGECERAGDWGGNITTPYETFIW